MDLRPTTSDAQVTGMCDRLGALDKRILEGLAESLCIAGMSNLEDCVTFLALRALSGDVSGALLAPEHTIKNALSVMCGRPVLFRQLCVAICGFTLDFAPMDQATLDERIKRTQHLRRAWFGGNTPRSVVYVARPGGVPTTIHTDAATTVLHVAETYAKRNGYLIEDVRLSFGGEVIFAMDADGFDDGKYSSLVKLGFLGVCDGDSLVDNTRR